MFMNLLTNPIIVGVVVGLPTSLWGFLAYRRAEKLDEEAARVAVIATEGVAVQRVIDGLDRMVTNLQTDNREARESLGDLARQLRECLEACDRLRRITHTQYDEGKNSG